MPEPEIGVNSTDDILKELLAVAKNIQGLLTEKKGQEARTTQRTNGASHKGEDSPEVPVATAHLPLITEMVNVETDNSNNWPNDETIAKYRNRCAKHKRECEKMQVELGCFVVHLGIVGGNKYEIEKTESLRKILLDPVQCLEKAFDTTADGRPDSMDEVRMSFDRLDDFVRDFDDSPHKKDSLYPDKVKQWFHFTRSGWLKIKNLVRDGKFVKCLEFIHDVFFSELETAMGSVVEALAIFEEKSASECLSTQKIGDYETWCAGYIKCVFPPTNDIGEPGAWPEPDERKRFGERLAEHKILCNEMWIELDHLISHYIIIRGDKVVIDATNLLKKELLSHAQYLELSFRDRQPDFRTKMSGAIQNLLHAAIRFQSSLYHQKHAFYFRKVKQWVLCLWVGTLRITRLMDRGEVAQCVKYIHYTFLPEFERVMIGVSHGEPAKLGDNSVSAVPEELKTFGKESLPKFIADQMERDTTQYVNLTTIATFFSSVTATTLQFTYAKTDAVPSNSLRGVVNLFWFLSLIFSVSSGVNSLLGLIWRRSSVYDLRVPPRFIRMWLDKAPTLFLIIAAVSFVIGLNLFAYLSLQPPFVTLTTSILTGLHGMCLLAVTLWVLYQLKREFAWIIWTRINTIRLRIRREAKRLHKTCKRNKPHLQRNFFWAFGVDNRVAQLNYQMFAESEWERDWPEPNILSQLIRLISYLIKTVWLATERVFTNLGYYMRKRKCVPYSMQDTEGDIELGDRDRREVSEEREETPPPESAAEKAKNEFRRSLLTISSDAAWVSEIMDFIADLERRLQEANNPSYLSRSRQVESFDRPLKKLLWGYPKLITKLDNEVRTALDKALNERRIDGEKEQQQEATIGHGNEDVASIPPQSSQIARLDDSLHIESELPNKAQTDVLSDSQGTEVRESLFGCPGTGEEFASNETVEVMSTLENGNIDSRIAQGSYELGE